MREVQIKRSPVIPALYAMLGATGYYQPTQGFTVKPEKSMRSKEQVERLKAKAAEKRARKAAFRRNQSCLVEHLHQKEYNNV